MRAPSYNTRRRKNRCVQCRRKIEHTVDKSAVKIDVCINTLIHLSLFSDDLRRKVLYFFIKTVFCLMAFFLRKLFHKPFEYIRSRIGDRINGMSHTVDQSFPVERFFIKKRFQICPDLIFVFPVCQNRLHILEHLSHFDVRAAVLRSFQRCHRSRDRRICIRSR